MPTLRLRYRRLLWRARRRALTCRLLTTIPMPGPRSGRIELEASCASALTPRRTKRGPPFRLEQQLDAIARLPKAEQRAVSTLLTAVLAQHTAPAGQEAAPAS